MTCGLRAAAVLALLALCAGAPAAAQERDATVADVRAELALLDAQIRQLREALVAQGAARGLPTDPATAFARLDQLEAELRRLTNRVDVLTNEIAQVVDDASNRVGEIEFRLTELEGGEPLAPAEPVPLGDGITPVPPPVPAPRGDGTATVDVFGGSSGGPVPGAEPAPEAQLAVAEQADFDAAVDAAEAGEPARAAELFQAFLATYPGGPLSGEARFRLGEAQAAQSDWQGAARSFLDAFSGAPDAPRAPRALYMLGVSLGQLGQVSQACLTLDEVDSRYPGSDAAAEVDLQRQTLRCP